MENKTPKREKKATRQAKRFRVHIEQVNATYVEVVAKDREGAAIKGYAKWKRWDAHSKVTWVQELR